MQRTLKLVPLLASLLLSATALATGNDYYRCDPSNTDPDISQFRSFTVQKNQIIFHEESKIYDRVDHDLYHGIIPMGTMAATYYHQLGLEVRALDMKAFFTFSKLQVSQDAQVTWKISQSEIPSEGSFPVSISVKLVDGNKSRLLGSQVMNCTPL